MKVIPTELPDVLVFKPDVFTDDRGYFFEAWNAEAYGRLGLDVAFSQTNVSRSYAGCLRGLHYQVGRPQGKLVLVTAGRIWDVAVDLRRGSTTFGRWVGEWLDAGSRRMLWIPPGFAHGFFVGSQLADVVYMCTTPYAPDGDRAVAWDDPELAVAWPLPSGTEPILSARDRAAPAFADAECYP